MTNSTTTERTDQRRVVGWARVYPALRRNISKVLRRGMWYPVARDDQPDRVSLWMGERTVDVPRRLLEVRRQRPGYFSVVNRVEYRREPGRPSRFNLGKQYAVCPECAHRSALYGRPEMKLCPACGYRGEVAWWEA